MSKIGEKYSPVYSLVLNDWQYLWFAISSFDLSYEFFLFQFLLILLSSISRVLFDQSNAPNS